MIASSIPSGPILPVWVVMPVAVILLLATAAHLMALRQVPMPESRRRIRTVNGWLMMLATPLVAYAFGIARFTSARMFVFIWACVCAAIMLIVMLAAIDMFNTMRLSRRDRSALAAELRAMRGKATPPGAHD